jgi:hypothetical protein
LLKPEAGLGLHILTEPSPSDVFLDFEGRYARAIGSCRSTPLDKPLRFETLNLKEAKVLLVEFAR